jgi:hypothetical protein
MYNTCVAEETKVGGGAEASYRVTLTALGVFIKSWRRCLSESRTVRGTIDYLISRPMNGCGFFEKDWDSQVTERIHSE